MEQWSYYIIIHTTLLSVLNVSNTLKVDEKDFLLTNLSIFINLYLLNIESQFFFINTMGTCSGLCSKLNIEKP